MQQFVDHAELVTGFQAMQLPLTFAKLRAQRLVVVHNLLQFHKMRHGLKTSL
jgi:hypothetical protein